MCDAAGKGPDGFHLIGLPDLGLQFRIFGLDTFAVRDVAIESQYILLVADIDHADAHFGGKGCSIFFNMQKLLVNPLPCLHASVPFRKLSGRLQGIQFQNRHAYQFIHGVAVHLRGRPVGLNDTTTAGVLGLYQKDGLAGLFKQLPVTLLAFDQGLLGLLVLSPFLQGMDTMCHVLSQLFQQFHLGGFKHLRVVAENAQNAVDTAIKGQRQGCAASQPALQGRPPHRTFGSFMGGQISNEDRLGILDCFKRRSTQSGAVFSAQGDCQRMFGQAIRCLESGHDQMSVTFRIQAPCPAEGKPADFDHHFTNALEQVDLIRGTHQDSIGTADHLQRPVAFLQLRRAPQDLCFEPLPHFM